MHRVLRGRGVKPVSHSQIALFFVIGLGKRSGEHSIAFLFWLPPDYGDSTAHLLIGIKE